MGSVKTTPEPILMSAWSVSRILAGSKVEARRKVGDYVEHYDAVSVPSQEGLRGGKEVDFYHYPKGTGMLVEPDYRPGDRLYVREPVYEGGDGVAKYEADNQWVETVGDNPRWFDPVNPGSNPVWPDKWSRDRQPSMFMPKAWSRILLEVTEVEVERVSEIDTESVIAEGIGHDEIRRMYSERGKSLLPNGDSIETLPDRKWRQAFRWKWEELHGESSWEEVWVWIIRYKVLRPELN